MKRLFFICLCLLMLSACDNMSKAYMPQRLLTEQEMMDVMTDVQIIEADINNQKAKEKEKEEKDTIPKDFVRIAENYYRQLFEHYGITDSIFTQNIKYYSMQPAVLERIMDSVTQRLTKIQSTSSTQ